MQTPKYLESMDLMRDPSPTIAYCIYLFLPVLIRTVLQTMGSCGHERPTQPHVHVSRLVHRASLPLLYITSITDTRVSRQNSSYTTAGMI